MSHSHRPTQKQSNKAYKSKHSSKGSLKDAAKGRIAKKTTSSSSASAIKNSNHGPAASQMKANRRNTAKQLQAAKRAQLADKNRLSAGKSEARAPRIVTFIQLCKDTDSNQAVHDLLTSTNNLHNDDGSETAAGSIRQVDLTSPRSTLQFITPAHGDLMASLDAVSMADFVILLLSGSSEVDAWGETCLRSLASLGVGDGAIRAVVSSLPENPAAVNQVRKSTLSFVRHFFPSIERMYTPSVASEASNLLRSLGDKIPRGVTWRDARPRLLAEQVEWQADHNEEPEAGPSTGTLAITGTIRGCNLSANRLVHLQGYGDFRIERIVSASTSNSKPKKHALTSANLAADQQMTDGDDANILSEPTPSEADDLISTNVPSEGDDLLAEQTWPTEDEIASAPANANGHSIHRTFGTELMPPPALPGTTPRRLRKVPKGTSAYQAAWIPDEDDEYDDDFDDEDDDDAMQDEDGQPKYEREPPLLQDSDEEYEEVDPAGPEDQIRGAPSSVAGQTSTGFGAESYQDLPMDIERSQYEAYQAQKKRDNLEMQRENKDDMEFPDEVDTPLDIPARERFARYRGLKSFRTSAWDAYENLPRDYARCFMFQDYKIMGKKLERRAREDGVEPGTRVTVYIKDVPQSVAASHSPKRPLMVFGLLKHEHKYSVSNFTLTRNTEYTNTIKSKDPLIVQIGCRRYNLNPIWSQHTQGNGGKGSNNVHKFERFLRHGPNAAVGTAYLPITFGSNVPAIVFQRQQDARSEDVGGELEQEANVDSGYELVGTGTLLGVDPTRIVAKRIILTGHPYKLHKKTATIRYMFFNQPDVDYYKPIELRTKKGRVGHIKESLGTHGYFKAGFDGPIDQMDTICLNLYKRCFPKWGSVWKVDQEPVEANHAEVDGDDADVEMA